LKSYLPALGWAIVIFILSTGASVQLPESIFSADKIGHFAAYFVLTTLLLWAIHSNGKWKTNWMFSMLFLASAYGTLLEFVQWAFFPNRFFEVWDMIANITGACIATFLFHFWRKKKLS